MKEQAEELSCAANRALENFSVVLGERSRREETELANVANVKKSVCSRCAPIFPLKCVVASSDHIFFMTVVSFTTLRTKWPDLVHKLRFLF